MYPKNWNTLRIQQETALAMGNKKFIEKEIKKGVLYEKYIGKATNGMEIELIFNNGILKTTLPIIKKI